MKRGSRSIEIPGIHHKSPLPMGARVGRMLYSSGIPGIDPKTGDVAVGAEAQVFHAFANMKSLLKAGGATLDDVIRVTVHIIDDSVRTLINPVWLECFPDAHDRPARHIQIYEHLKNGMLVQVEVIAECEADA